MPHTATLPLLLKQLKLTTMGRHWERLLQQAGEQATGLLHCMIRIGGKVHDNLVYLGGIGKN